MRRGAGAAALLVWCGTAQAQTPDVTALPAVVPASTKLTLKADSALLYESNPLSVVRGAKPAWSRTHTFGAALDVPVTENLVWAASAQTKFWRYFRFPSYDDNEVTAGSSLTAKFGAASLSLRYSHYGAYSPDFGRRFELRDDIGASASYRFVDKERGLSATPSLGVLQRRDNDHALDRRRLSASLPALWKSGAFSVSGRLGLAYDLYRLCAAPRCRRDLRLYAEAGAAYEISKNAELALGVDFERGVSNLDGKGYNGLTVAPKIALQIVF